MTEDVMGPGDALEWELDQETVEAEGLEAALPPRGIDG